MAIYRSIRILPCLVLAAFSASAAQTGGGAKKPIQDNSFLLEEAYNQEKGVVQHISSVVFDRRIDSWVYALTDEWPVNGQRHQLSLTVPLQNGANRSPVLGNLALNYRLQMVG